MSQTTFLIEFVPVHHIVHLLRFQLNQDTTDVVLPFFSPLVPNLDQILDGGKMCGNHSKLQKNLNSCLNELRKMTYRVSNMDNAY